MSTSPIAQQATVGSVFARGAMIVSWLLAVVLFFGSIELRQDLPGQMASRHAGWILAASMAWSVLFWLVLLVRGNRLAATIGVPGLSLIGTISAVHFAIAAGSRVFGQLLAGLLGPAAIFVQGVGDEGIPCLLSAVLIVLRPRPGVVTFSLVTVFLLMVITSGTLGLTAFIFFSTSALLHEGLLAGLGITTGRQIHEPRRSPPPSVVVRIALAIGIANGLALYLQFVYYGQMYRLDFSPWYVLGVAGIVGVSYGAAGAALGATLGYRLRNILP